MGGILAEGVASPPSMVDMRSVSEGRDLEPDSEVLDVERGRLRPTSPPRELEPEAALVGGRSAVGVTVGQPRGSEEGRVGEGKSPRRNKKAPVVQDEREKGVAL